MADSTKKEEILTTLGYQIKDNQLVKIVDESPFEFIDQSHYEEISKGVLHHIQERMVRDLGLHFVDLSEFLNPAMVAKYPEVPSIFASSGVLGKGPPSKTLLLVIQGSGAVRAGEWARSVSINDNILSGSQILYLERALKNGWDVIVFNPNQPHTFRGPISQLPVRNVGFVWEKFIEGRKEKYLHLGIVAHSAGAQQSLNLLEDYEECGKKLRAIAFTDGVFRMGSERTTEILNQKGKNWVASSLPLGEEPSFHPVKTMMPCVSAGHPEHTW
eukprot:CAMPEP_0201489254 /NCGR_PEP_ID=MMETSP0151_2-20130828/21613_1 /ASSEMBLY_ACC=CAM_ASM_000257 /TAXON_ID=200890 /ORGANISM="Paramoeba atlantica, Strain 621/1 / CCAP 1560/9" /LENGTH=271 /DNA_ID=CAMNT_0047874785 /DNA_START=66 /DNA_END=878 /DNA_ORIENTATION=+